MFRFWLKEQMSFTQSTSCLGRASFSTPPIALATTTITLSTVPELGSLLRSLNCINEDVKQEFAVRGTGRVLGMELNTVK